MNPLARLFALLAVCCAAPLSAQSYSVVVYEWVEVAQEPRASRYVSPEPDQAEHAAIATYGPFRVIDAHTAELVGVTDRRSPASFAALLRAHPEIEVLDFVEAPGTHDDVANLEVGRMIRQHGIATRAGRDGSIRSGAVELFLAGATREIDPGAEFAVHGWLDESGRGAEDYPMSAPEHRRYLAYYAEMGMDAALARAFYAMTNSVPYESALWLSGSEMRDWLDMPAVQAPAVPQYAAAQPLPRLAYLDLGSLLQ